MSGQEEPAELGIGIAALLFAGFLYWMVVTCWRSGSVLLSILGTALALLAFICTCGFCIELSRWLRQRSR